MRNYKCYCKDYENIENYDKAKKDNFKGWDCHHRLETHTSEGERRLVDITRKELIALGMYLHRPASELIFMKHSEHNSLHSKGKKHSEEARKKMSEADIGNKNALGYKHSEEAKKKISDARNGMHWFNNGKINKLCYECPDGFIPGRLLIK